MEIRFLNDYNLSDLHATFLRAFSDYVIPMQLTREQFEQLLHRRGAKNDISVAAFEHGPVGFTINAFEDYQGVPTLYDVVTGILPEYRRQGIGKQIFDFSMPYLQKLGAKRYALEVFEKNEPAVRLYKKMGFQIRRRLYVFNRAIPVGSESRSYEIRPIQPQWELFQTFWDWHPSWQNSISCMERMKSGKYIAGVFQGNILIGYGIVFTQTGDIPQFAIAHNHRRNGAGTTLLNHLQSVVDTSHSVRAVNVDGSAADTIAFLERIGFSVLGTQNEMILNFG